MNEAHLAQPYNDKDLEAQRAAINHGTADSPLSRPFATIDALRIEKGYRRCVNCHLLRPPHGTQDDFGRESGFYENDLTCAECRRNAAPNYR